MPLQRHDDAAKQARLPIPPLLHSIYLSLIHIYGRCICGKTNDIVTEENIQKTFGVNVKIAEVSSGGRTVKTIGPVSAADGS